MEKSQDEKLGWVVSNSEDGKTEIQRHDETGRFDSDEEAVVHVAETYVELLEACELAQNKLLEHYNFGEVEELNILRKVIKKVKGDF